MIAEVIASDLFVSRFSADDTQRSVLHKENTQDRFLTSVSSLVVSMFIAGAFFGAAFAGATGNYFGRRWTITIFGCVIFCLGGSPQTGARTLDYLYSGRFLAGLG